MNNEHLTFLANIILSGEPLPLSWVVENQNEWDSYWKESQDPAIMMRIAGHVVPRRELVFTVAQIAKPVLKYEPSLRQVVTLAEDWSAGSVTLAEVVQAYYNTKSNDNIWYVTQSATGDSYNAAKAASDAAYRFARILTTSSDDRSLPVETIRQKSKRKIANIIRKHIRITVSDLVGAGRRGWNPP